MTTVPNTCVDIFTDIWLFTLIILMGQFVQLRLGKNWNFPIQLYYWNLINTALFAIMLRYFINTYPLIKNKRGLPGPRGKQGKKGRVGPRGI